MTEPKPSKADAGPLKVRNAFLVLLLVLVLWGLERMLAPFAGALVAAIVLGVVFIPLHHRVERAFSKRSRNFNAFLSTLSILLFFLVPLSLLTWTVVSEAKRLAPTIKESQEVFQDIRQGETVESIPKMRDLRRWLSAKIGITRAGFERSVRQLANMAVAGISATGGQIAKVAIDFSLGLTLVLLTLFFVFRDGPSFYAKTMSYVPLDPDVKTRLTEKMDDTINGVIRGWFLTAVAQGIVATIGYLIIQAPSALLLGVLTAVTGLIPSVGTALVWIPVSLILLSQGSTASGVFLFVYGSCVISVVDNFLRPMFVGQRADLPFLYLLFALLGGIKIWGLKGIIIGPLLITITPVLLEAFHRNRLGRKETSDAA